MILLVNTLFLLVYHVSCSWFARADLGVQSKQEQSDVEYNALNVVANVVSYARILMTTPLDDSNLLHNQSWKSNYRILLRPSLSRTLDNARRASKYFT